MTAQQAPDRDRLRKLCEDAHPGPWEHEPEAGWVEVTADKHCAVIAGQVRPRNGFGGRIYEDNYEPTAEFIAAARTAVPALLDALDQAEARIKAVRDALDNPIRHRDWEDPLVSATRVRRALEG